MTGVVDAVVDGRQALANGQWGDAKLAFESALAVGESAAALEGLGTACRWLGEPGGALRALTRAYRLYRRDDDPVGAARVATQLALGEMYFRMEPAVARGWLARAERLVAGLAPTAEGAVIETVQASQALGLVRNVPDALTRARGAQELARQAGASDVEMTAVAMEGPALVFAGETKGGMRLLDEATTAAVGGEMDDPI